MLNQDHFLFQSLCQHCSCVKLWLTIKTWLPLLSSKKPAESRAHTLNCVLGAANEWDWWSVWMHTCMYLFISSCTFVPSKESCGHSGQRDMLLLDFLQRERQHWWVAVNDRVIILCWLRGPDLHWGCLKNPVFAHSTYRFSFTLQYLSKQRYLNVQPQKFKWEKRWADKMLLN